jgi:uncharacterized cupredoxin-like copper-binding protein
MKTFSTPIALLLLICLLAGLARAAPEHAHAHDDSTIGAPGDAAKVNRTVTINMSDAMRFTPSGINVSQGETIRFHVKNSGKIRHEFVLGTAKDLQQHYELMKKFPKMEHADPNMVSVAPGQTGEVIWQFTKVGKINFACLQPGHFDAGMKGAVSVASRKAAGKGVNADEHSQHPH